MLTLKTPSKIVAEDISFFFILFFRENKTWHFMWIVWFTKIPSLILSEKKIEIKKNQTVGVWDNVRWLFHCKDDYDNVCLTSTTL